MKLRRTLVSILVLALFAPAATDRARAESDPHVDARHENHIQQIEKESRRYRQATQDAARLEKEFRHSRQRRYPRGDALQKMREDLDLAREDRRDAAERIPMLIERARRDGVAPGKLRRFENVVPASDS